MSVTVSAAQSGAAPVAASLRASRSTSVSASPGSSGACSASSRSSTPVGSRSVTIAPLTGRANRAAPLRPGERGGAAAFMSRLGDFRDAWIDLPALVLQFDMLQRNRIGAGVEVGQRLELRHPAAVHDVAAHRLTCLRRLASEVFGWP